MLAQGQAKQEPASSFSMWGGARSKERALPQWGTRQMAKSLLQRQAAWVAPHAACPAAVCSGGAAGPRAVPVRLPCPSATRANWRDVPDGAREVRDLWGAAVCGAGTHAQARLALRLSSVHAADARAGKLSRHAGGDVGKFPARATCRRPADGQCSHLHVRRPAGACRGEEREAEGASRPLALSDLSETARALGP